MPGSGWAVARAVSFLMYFSGGLALFERLDRGADPRPRCTVLNYHRVVEPGPGYRDIAVSPATFRRHVEYLSRRGFRFLTLTQYHEYLAGERTLDGDSVLVTFDDGYRDNHTAALPVLREFGVPAALFLCTGPIDHGPLLWWDRATEALLSLRRGSVTPVFSDTADSAGLAALVRAVLSAGDSDVSASIGHVVDRLKRLPRPEREAVLGVLEGASPDAPRDDLMLTWEMVRDMHRSGVEFGAHSVSHPSFAELDADEATAEMVGSKNAIEREIGAEVTAFAYPYGKGDFFDTATVEVLRACGLKWAYTTENGRNEPGADPCALRRNGMRDVPTYVLAVRMSGLFEHPALALVRAALERPSHASG